MPEVRKSLPPALQNKFNALQRVIAVSARLPWLHLLSALGGFFLLRLWNYLRTPTFLREVCELTRFLGPAKVIQWLKIQKAKTLAERNPVDEYDVVVRLESVIDLNLEIGCPIITSSGQAADIFEKPISVRTVAVLGLYNTGKSFLQSSLFGYNFPQGPCRRTTGLSMKYVEKSNLLIIDSAGNLEPVSAESWTLEDAVRDRKDVELMIKELVIQLADVLIVAVNDITWPEQEFCQTLTNRCVQKPRKCLIVLHNMQHIFDPDVAKSRFHEHVSQLYKGTQVKDIVGAENVLEFVHRDTETDLVVNHFGLAYQFSPAGLKYNEGAFQRIRAVIDFYDRIGSKRCIKDVLESHGTALLPRFFYCEDGAATCKLKLAFERSAVNYRVGPLQKAIGGFFLRPPEGMTAHWRRSTATLFDSVGSTTTFRPAFSITLETTRRGEEVMHLQIEAPGCNEDNLLVEDVGEGLLVAINKVREAAENSITKVVEDGQAYSIWKHVFEYKIPGCGAFEAPHNDQRGVYIQDGMAHIWMPRRAKAKGILNVQSAQAENSSVED